MKIYKRFVAKTIFIGVLMIFVFSLLSVAQEQPETSEENELDSLFKWLKAEAVTTVSVATRTEMTINDAPSVVSVITGEEIRNSGAKNLEDVLRQVAGFYVHPSSIFPDTDIAIRGISEGSSKPGIKIMINDHSIDNPLDQNLGWMSDFPVDMIKKIEIIRGPGSALYGTEAMNGVINILTKDGKDPSAVSFAYGSFDTYRGIAQLSYAESDVNLYFFADTTGSNGDPQWIEKDGASVQFPPGYTDAPGYTTEEYEAHHFFTKLTYQNFYLTGFYKNSSHENPIGILNILTDENDISSERAFAEGGYEGNLTNKIRISARAYYDYAASDLEHEFFGENTAAFFNEIFPEDKPFPEDEGIAVNFIQKLYKVGGEFMADINLTDSIELVAGVSYEYINLYDTSQKSNANMVGNMELNGITYNRPMQYLGGFWELTDYPPVAEADRTAYAGYVQGTWDMLKTFPALDRFGKNLTITAGLRYDDYNDIGDTLNPRMGVVYAPNDALFFKLLYGEAFRAPGFNEMYFQNNGGVAEGNPNLNPEIMKTSEILAGINLTDHITATADVFYVKRENIIRLYQGKFENWGKVESKGAEGEIRVFYDKNKYGYFNITFQKAEDVSHEKMTDTGGTEYTQKDINFGMYPEVIANMGINCDITKHVNANVSVNYISSIERIGKMQFTPDETDPDGTVEKIDKREPMDGYTLVNLSLTFGNFEFAKGWEFQLTGYNIFNADYKSPEKEGLVENDMPLWDRHFMGKLTYMF